MLNTRKLVYILPEVCYVAELLPTKKPHTFSIQSFRQINAKFMEDEELLIDTVKKLFKKLEPENYTIILPDFLFTNTIIDVAQTDEASVREYLVSKLLPSLGLDKDSHQLETFILTQHKGKTKVQLSGLEKSILGPVFPIAEERGIKIDAICPLSWTLKSVISLEPSLSAIELGQHLYVAQHYIGVEQSTFFPTSELDNVVETVRTLRGAEPNIQTLYLLTSQETGEEIKSKLKQRIPLQQLAEDEVSMDGLPAHLKTAIEAAAKTLDIEDYPVPRFKLENYQPKVVEEKVEVEEEAPAPAKEEAALKQPSIEIFEESLGDDEEDEAPIVAPALPAAMTPISITTTTVELEEVSPDSIDLKAAGFLDDQVAGSEPEPTLKSEIEEEPLMPMGQTQFVDRGSLEDLDEPETLAEAAALATKQPVANDWLDDTDEEVMAQPVEEKIVSAVPQSKPSLPTRERAVIKNHNSTGSMVKMIGISIAALIITVLVGVGAGFALLKHSENTATATPAATPKASPVAVKPSVAPVASATPAPGASGSATTSLAKDKVKILVVNATGVSGKAGKAKTALSTAGYKTVDTGNAKGTYKAGNFVLMDKQDTAFLGQLQKDTSINLSFGTEKKTTEDAAGKYDVIVVINE